MYQMDHFNLDKVPQQHPDQLDKSPSSGDWYEWVQHSDSVSVCPVIGNCGRENSEMSLNETQLFGDWPEYEFDGENKMAWEDDFSMNSFLKDDRHDMEVPYRSVDMYTETVCNSTPFDDLFTDTVVDSQNNSRDQSYSESSKYMKHDMSQPMYWNKFDETSHFMLYKNTDEMKVPTETKAPVLKILIPSELKTSIPQDGHVDEEMSFRATEFHDLKELMTQLAPKTRIFFRDALYRLANNSKQQRSQSQNQSGELTLNEPELSAVHRGTSTFGKRKLMELETNVIDRGVAKLMFNELNCNATEDSCIESVDLFDESVTGTSSCNNSFNQSALQPCHYQYNN